MATNRTLLISLAVVSAILMLLLGFLSNLASTYMADTLKPYAGWIFLILGIVFLASLGVLIWQMRLERTTLPASDRAIEQQAEDGGKIKGSPNEITGPASASIRQTASSKGSIENSGNTIK